MRDIKYKVWDDDLKMMSNPMNPFLSNILTFGNGGVGTHFKSVTGAMKFMQFTELKDRNGKNIYDGDILASEGRVIGHIEGGVRGYCYDVVYLNPTGDKRWSLYACLTTDYEGNIEVIGNIHEHPELLK